MTPDLRVTSSLRHFITSKLLFPVEQLHAHAVRRVDESDTGRGVEVGRVETEGNALLAQAGAEAVEISLDAHAEVIDAPLQSGLVIRHLGGALSAHDDDEAAERHVDLRGALDFEAARDLSSELVDIPVGGGFRVLGQQVDVVEGYAGIRHGADSLDESPMMTQRKPGAPQAPPGVYAAPLTVQAMRRKLPGLTSSMTFTGGDTDGQAAPHSDGSRRDGEDREVLREILRHEARPADGDRDRP